MDFTQAFPQANGLSVSIVVYHPDAMLLQRTLASLAAACRELRRVNPGCAIELFLVDNGGLGPSGPAIDMVAEDGVQCRVISGHGNVGYGRGHNMAIDLATSAFHLILNPDIDLDRSALISGCDFLMAHPEVGLVAPSVGDGTGALQYLCRRYPAIIDLLIRAFMPAAVRRLFAHRLARYEMRDMVNDRDVIWDPPIVSGCFMLYRTDILKKLDGFDPRYFLYFEDYDLSLRTHEVSHVAYVPRMHVVHHGGGASRKGFAHIRMFAASALKFYNRFGWKLW
ncbi:glycosyl transferase [Burkholderia sp. FL-7-2-10-S1-D7]|uniref:glycosyltransferase n=1 Tax=Burkholderia sp. FL-7-2-10-S1-D7 TaxID=1637866 RepID=UPI000755B879|nr:glycosyltransferase [Burkholderia sp. FL-7-2-10-S1-D7]KVF74421.1 glycosyl transferase [Burkholderia sp. FL-7-2-10-S1-D7]